MGAPKESDSAASLVRPEQVYTELNRLLRDQRHMGVRNLVSDSLLEPRNPFQSTRRKPKKWVVAIAGLFLLAFLIVYSFHIR